MADYVVSGFNKTDKVYEALSLAAVLALSAAGELSLGTVNFSDLTGGSLSSLNAIVSDATLDDSGDPRDPNAHASDHTDGSDDIQSATAAQKGLMTTAYAGKVDGIESGATADQTGSEIKVAYEGEANTNAFTDALLSKLNAVEALADVTDETNVLAALANSAAAKDQGGGNITNVGTVDGRDVGTDGTKLDGIEASADVTDTTNVAAAGALLESKYNAQSVVVAVLDNSPVVQVVGDSEFVGRSSGGDVGVVTKTQALAILNVEDGADVTDFDSVKTALAAANTSVDFNDQKITGLGTPTLDADSATKLYVDNLVATGTRDKPHSDWGTTANVSTFEYDQDGGSNNYGTLTDTDLAFAPFSPDGTEVEVGDIVLVKDQAAHKVTTFQVLDYTGLDAEYITLYNSGDVQYDFWFDGTGATGEPGGLVNPQEVDISADTSNEEAAATLQGVIDGVTGFNSFTDVHLDTELGEAAVIVINVGQGTVTASATSDAPDISVTNETHGGPGGTGSAVNGTYVVDVQGNGIDTNTVLQRPYWYNGDPHGEVNAGDKTFVVEGTANAGQGYTQLNPDIYLTQSGGIIVGLTSLDWTVTSTTTTYTFQNGVTNVGAGVIEADVDTGMSLASGKIRIDYTAEHTFSNVLDISDPTKWEMNNIAFVGTMGNINTLVGGEFSDATALLGVSQIVDPSNFLTRQNVLAGQLVTKGTDVGGVGWYLCDASDLSLSITMAVAAAEELADSALDVYLKGHGISVLFDKDHSGGSPSDPVVIHPSRPGFATMGADFTTGYYSVVGYLIDNVAAGDGLTDAPEVVELSPQPESRILIS